MSASLNIGLVAYHVTGNLAFVRVPSERGRYMLTDLSVIAVSCPMCGAVIGEPCRSGSWSNGEPSPRWASRPSVNGHGTSVHVARKSAADAKYGRGWKRTVLSHYQVHLAAGDVAAAMADAPDIDFPVTRRVDAK